MDLPLSTSSWILFGAIVVVLLVLDLFTLRGERGGNRRLLAAWTAVWFSVGLGFAAVVAWLLGAEAAQEYVAAWVIEKSLSLDNLFVFLLIFHRLKIPEPLQHRVLFWGILGAIVFRAVFVFLGAAALERWSWVSWIFAALLMISAIQAWRHDPRATDDSPVVDWLARHLPVTSDLGSGRFLVRQGGRLVATPLMLALLAIEAMDVAFAIDSVPAALSMTRRTFVVYTSNIFAILGLRALYLLLAHALTQLSQLHRGLAAILAFAAVKMVIDRWVHVPAWLSVVIIVGLLGLAIASSVRAARRAPGSTAEPPDSDSPRPRGPDRPPPDVRL